MILNFFTVFLGSGLGGACRYALGSWLNGTYPLGTLVANVLGCFLIGLFSRILPADAQVKLLLVAGFCGGFTTFSTFINENLLMLRGGQILLSLAYACLSLCLGMLAAWLAGKISL